MALATLVSRKHQTSLAIHSLTSSRGCVTPSVLANLKQTSEDDLDLVDGYDELPQPLQQKVERALEHGHVDDEDWKGVSDPSLLYIFV